jgi:hypothetical protein
MDMAGSRLKPWESHAAFRCLLIRDESWFFSAYHHETMSVTSSEEVDEFE